MVQGTASSVGKSLLVTALCRILRQDGYRVAPFKAQNMSNNSYVTADGGEIGRAQAVQAEAAGVPPEVVMNPVLLKPEADHRSQIVLNGRPHGTVQSSGFLELKPTLWPSVTAALDELRQRFEVVVIEGAGSPAEINLRSGDIVNMRLALYAQAPVLLVGDIDRGGVFAHLIGTLMLLEPEERALVRALVINKFRGDASLLEPGLEMLQERAGLPIAGVIPFLPEAGIAIEDAASLDSERAPAPGIVDVAVVRLPHIANFDDFDPLEHEPAVSLRYVTESRLLGRPDLVILPGSKATIADLSWLRSSGLATALLSAQKAGTAVIGICGGYQMLGRWVRDPELVESDVLETEGLGLLSIDTQFALSKLTHQVHARIERPVGLLSGADGAEIGGYEIHMGRTSSNSPAAFRIDRRSGSDCADDDGAMSEDGWTLGTYLHGLLANDDLRQTVLVNLARRKGIELAPPRTGLGKEAAYDRLAEHVRSAIDMKLVRRIMALDNRGRDNG